MLICELLVLLTWAAWLYGDQKNAEEKHYDDYGRLMGQSHGQMSPEDDGDEEKDQTNSAKRNVDFHQNFGEFYYESLQQPIVETDVLVPIKREELPIPLNDRTKKRELAEDDDLHEVVDHIKDRQPPRPAADISAGNVRGIRKTAMCNSPIRAYPPTSCSGAARQPLEVDGECVMDRPLDFSWMTCDAEIQDWAYRRNSRVPEEKTRWNGVVQVAPSPSFKQIIDGFWRDQSGLGFMAMYDKVKTSYESKLDKREMCGKREVDTQVFTKWQTLKDQVMEVRRDIRRRMVRKAQMGQLPKPGMIFLRDEELISEELEFDGF